MGYVRSIYKDELEELLDRIRLEIQEDKKISEDSKRFLEEFVYIFDKHIKEDFTHVTTIDLRKKPCVNSNFVF